MLSEHRSKAGEMALKVVDKKFEQLEKELKMKLEQAKNK